MVFPTPPKLPETTRLRPLNIAIGQPGAQLSEEVLPPAGGPFRGQTLSLSVAGRSPSAASATSACLARAGAKPRWVGQQHYDDCHAVQPGVVQVRQLEAVLAVRQWPWNAPGATAGSSARLGAEISKRPQSSRIFKIAKHRG